MGCFYSTEKKDIEISTHSVKISTHIVETKQSNDLLDEILNEMPTNLPPDKLSDKIPDSALSLDKMFSLAKTTILARIVEVYDGDTVTAIIFCNNLYVKFKIRLAHIDTCEKKINTSTFCNDCKQKAEKLMKHSIKAKARLIELLTNGKIVLDIKKIDSEYCNQINKNIKDMNCIVKMKITKYESKFGRQIGEIYSCTDTSLTNQFNMILLNEKLAYEYNGSTKLTMEEQIEILGL